MQSPDCMLQQHHRCTSSAILEASYKYDCLWLALHTLPEPPQNRGPPHFERLSLRTPLMGPVLPLVRWVRFFLLGRRSGSQMSARAARPLGFFCTTMTCCWHAGTEKLPCGFAVAFDLVVVGCSPFLSQVLPLFSAVQISSWLMLA